MFITFRGTAVVVQVNKNDSGNREPEEPEPEETESWFGSKRFSHRTGNREKRSRRTIKKVHNETISGQQRNRDAL